MAKRNLQNEKALPSPASAPLLAPVSTAFQPLGFTRKEISGITLEGVCFDSRTHRLVVADQPEGPDSLWLSAKNAATTRQALAATNAGFFTPEGKPLGLVRSEGKSTGTWNDASSLGNGIWYETTAGKSALVRRSLLARTAARELPELLQAGPLLMENTHAVTGLNATKTASRTLILWDGGSRWWLGRASACTLDALAKHLAANSPTLWPLFSALNFDGGHSTDLWVSSAVPGGPVERRSVFSRPVRNFLLLLPR